VEHLLRRSVNERPVHGQSSDEEILAFTLQVVRHPRTGAVHAFMSTRKETLVDQPFAQQAAKCVNTFRELG
jgi:hypothetical protein